MGNTTLPVSDEVADELHDRKPRGETYDSVLRELLGMDQTHETVES